MMEEAADRHFSMRVLGVLVVVNNGVEASG